MLVALVDGDPVKSLTVCADRIVHFGSSLVLLSINDVITASILSPV